MERCRRSVQPFHSSISHSGPHNRRAGFIPPYALQRILTALSDPSPHAKNSAYLFALIAFLANLSFAQVDVNKGWYTRRCYERTRGQLFCALHYKYAPDTFIGEWYPLTFVLRALKRRDVSGKSPTSTQKDDSQGDSENSADLGRIVNLMQSVELILSVKI